MFFTNVKVFSVASDQYNASLLNKVIKFLPKTFELLFI